MTQTITVPQRKMRRGAENNNSNDVTTGALAGVGGCSLEGADRTDAFSTDYQGVESPDAVQEK